MARLDQELVSRGLARSRTHAAKLIAAGRVVRGGAVLSKASIPIQPEESLRVTDDGVPDYVSRAGHKLAGALQAFPAVDPAGLRCLDAGASTGGFTDVLLRAGAREVAAVDVGHGQLVDSLRADPRVRVFEGMNVRYFTPDDIGGTVDLTVADLSFISLAKVVHPLAAATSPGGSLLLMVKPQFEVGRKLQNRSGVVTAPARHRLAVELVADAAVGAGLEIAGIARSPLPGQAGNVEFFMWITVPEGTARSAEDRAAAASAFVNTVFEQSPAFAEAPEGVED